MLNDLLLLSGNDIPFPEAQLTIHQPTIKEIAYIGEENFYTGCEFLKFSKDKLDEKDRIHLENYSNFDVLMSIMKEKNAVVQKNKICVSMVLAIMFPLYSISFSDTAIIFKKEGTEEVCLINNNNFEEFKKILNQIFCLGQGTGIDGDYNPSGDIAKRIADKLNRRKQKLAEIKPQEHKIAILSRYLSILTIGQNMNLNDLLQYTVYQLFDIFERYQLKVQNDFYFKAKLAGASDLQEVEDWMKDIHP